MTAPYLGPLCDYQARIISLLGRSEGSDIHRVIDLLLRCDAASSESITIFLSCQGGSMVDGLKFIDVVSLLRSPLTAVGMGLVEGAGLLLLAMAQERVLFPNAIISTAGLWELPDLHPTARRAMGLHENSSAQHDLHAQIAERMAKVIHAFPGKLPSSLVTAQATPRLFNATTAIENGWADAIVEGPNRFLNKVINRSNHHVNSSRRS